MILKLLGLFLTSISFRDANAIKGVSKQYLLQRCENFNGFIIVSLASEMLQLLRIYPDSISFRDAVFVMNISNQY